MPKIQNEDKNSIPVLEFLVKYKKKPWKIYIHENSKKIPEQRSQKIPTLKKARN